MTYLEFEGCIDQSAKQTNLQAMRYGVSSIFEKNEDISKEHHSHTHVSYTTKISQHYQNW